MVEQFDTEEFAALSASDTFPTGDNIDAASHVPPVHTKTWFHTGVYLGREHVSDFFAGLMNGHDRGEYYREPAWRDDDVEAEKRLLDDTVLPDDLTVEEEREACRALKGAMLRQEVYADDAPEGAAEESLKRARRPTPSLSRTSRSNGCSHKARTATRCSLPMPAKPSAITTSATRMIPASRMR